MTRKMEKDKNKKRRGRFSFEQSRVVFLLTHSGEQLFDEGDFKTQSTCFNFSPK